MDQVSSSPDKLKERLSVFKFESPQRRSPRTTKPSIKQDPDSETSHIEVFGKAVSPSSKSTREPPSTPRKRKFKGETGDAGASSSAKKPKRGYAPPEQYAHLNFLQDYLQEDLDVLFCGVNPGCMSAKVGHHFANPTNHFWRCLHRSGLTDRLLLASEDFTLPETYNLGLTNLVDRPSAEQAELSKQDMLSGVPVLLRKIQRFHPRIVTFVGKGIWETFIKEASKFVQKAEPLADQLVANSDAIRGHDSGPSNQVSSSETGNIPTKRKASGRAKTKKRPVFDWGIQPFKVVSREAKETLFFVMPSTSGRVVSHQLNDKVKLFTILRERLTEVKSASIDTSEMMVIPTHGED